MYLDNLKTDFYEFVTGKRICLIVNYDIDGICTCKILQSLLKFNQTVYTLAVVQGIGDLKTVYEEHCKDVKYFVLLNCGGTIDIVELLEPEDHIVFFILDSHRPTDLCNIYSNGQIKLLWNNEDEIPEFQDVFREESDDEENDEDGSAESEDESEGRPTKRRRLGEEEITRRRTKRLWEANREKVLFEYSQFTYYTKASAILMFDLAWKLNRDDKDLLWYAIVALSEQLVFGKIEHTEYVLETGNLQAHSTRLQNRTSDTDSATSLKVTFERDLQLMLYRHWTVAESVKYSMFTACKLKLWSFKGDDRVQKLLAEIGLPIVQSKQNFISMDLELRQEFHTSLERVSEQYGLTDIMYATFSLSYGYRNKYSASDVVYAMLAILEAAPKSKTAEENFQLALDSLSRSNKAIINVAIGKAKSLAKSIFKAVQSALETKRIISAGPFIYYIVQEGSLDWFLLANPHVLSLLGQFILRAYVAMARQRSKASSLPLIVSAPKSVENSSCIIMGLPPLCENSPKNFFGKAFEQAAERTNCDTMCDYFDTAYFEIPIKDRTRFFDALTDLLL